MRVSGTRPRSTLAVALLSTLLGLLGPVGISRAEGPNAVVALPGCATSTLAANDDGSSPSPPLGFTANFFGTDYANVFANNNGNATFGSNLSTFTATPIQGPTR